MTNKRIYELPLANTNAANNDILLIEKRSVVSNTYTAQGITLRMLANSVQALIPSVQAIPITINGVTNTSFTINISDSPDANTVGLANNYVLTWQATDVKWTPKRYYDVKTADFTTKAVTVNAASFGEYAIIASDAGKTLLITVDNVDNDCANSYIYLTDAVNATLSIGTEIRLKFIQQVTANVLSNALNYRAGADDINELYGESNIFYTNSHDGYLTLGVAKQMVRSFIDFRPGASVIMRKVTSNNWMIESGDVINYSGSYQNWSSSIVNEVHLLNIGASPQSIGADRGYQTYHNAITYHNNTAGYTFNLVGANSSQLSVANGYTIHAIQANTGQISVANGTGVTLIFDSVNYYAASRIKGSRISMIYLVANTWFLDGDLEPV